MTLPNTSVITIERFIMDQERRYPEATGELSNLLYDIALGGQDHRLGGPPRRAHQHPGLGRRHQHPGRRTAEARRLRQRSAQELDESHRAGLRHGVGRGRRNRSRSPRTSRTGKYAVLFDPLDGSSNIDNNNPVGTIFSIYRRRTRWTATAPSSDVLQPGHNQIAAGYVMYGSSVMLVYTTGQGVHGFTLDPTIGEFVLSHPNIRTPRAGKVLQRQRELLRPLVQGNAAGGAGLPRGLSRPDSRQEQPLHRRAGGGLPPQPGRAAASSSIRDETPSPAASSGSATRPARWRSWRSRPAAPRPTGSAGFSTWCPSSCTSARRWSSDRPGDVEFVRQMLIENPA